MSPGNLAEILMNSERNLRVLCYKYGWMRENVFVAADSEGGESICEALKKFPSKYRPLFSKRLLDIVIHFL